MINNETQNIVFFDGVCNLCNHFLDWLIRRDGKGQLKFASLQGKTAAQFLGPLNEDSRQWSIVFLEEGKTYHKSTAVLRILIKLGGIWRMAKIFLWLPVVVRDKIYDFIAKRRYRWFGQKSTCRLPTLEERSRFLS